MTNRFPLIRLRKNGRILVTIDGDSLNVIIALDRRRESPEDLPSNDDASWFFADAKLTRAAATKLRDQLDAWLKDGAA